MNGLMHENQLTIVEEYENIKPLIHKIDSIIEYRIRDCHKSFFHTFQYKCVYDIQLTNIGNIEVVNSTIGDESMKLNELNEKRKIARENGFIINETEKLILKTYSSLSKNNIQY